MADVLLTAETRPERGSRPAGRLRRTGKVPAVVYGLDTDPISVTVPARELAHLLAGEGGANTLIRLQVDGDEQLTLARQIQRHPTRGDLVHVDFVRIRRDVAVQAEVPLHLVGEAPGSRDGGLVEQLIFSLSIEAKPADIPNVVEVDISALEIGDQLRIAEVTVDEGVTFLHESDELVVQVVAPRLAEVEETAEGEEGAEGVEGAVAADGDSSDDAGGDSELPVLRRGPRAERTGTPADYLVVGLGNPGDEYALTRHNVGADVVELLARRQGAKLRKAKKEHALVDEVRIGTSRVALAVPLTYMNDSGQAVQALARRFGVDADRIVIVHDELDLPVAELRVKSGGGLAGHNGLKSIKQHLHDDRFARVRIGVGKPQSREQGANHVLNRFSKRERSEVDVTVERAADAVETIVTDGVDTAMNHFN